MNYWIFNTDETEEIGAGKHKAMFKKQVIAAHGWCKGIGAERTLNKPSPGDMIFYFRAGHGFVASATAGQAYAVATAEIFGAKREFLRPIYELRILDEDDAISVAEVKSVTGKQTSYRHIVSQIHSRAISRFLLKRFGGVKPRTPEKKNRPSSKSNGGGFQPDPVKRVQVEKAAVACVTELYEEKGWDVASVEQDKVGYDLHCTKGNQVDCVEVKGTSGKLEEFILTANEFEKAKTDDDFVLYVVTNALSNPTPKKYAAKLLLVKFEMTPLSYRVKPKR